MARNLWAVAQAAREAQGMVEWPGQGIGQALPVNRRQLPSVTVAVSEQG